MRIESTQVIRVITNGVTGRMGYNQHGIMDWATSLDEALATLKDGGGIVLDMFPHWAYMLEGLFGAIEAVTARAVTHIPQRWDEGGVRYDATAEGRRVEVPA